MRRREGWKKKRKGKKEREYGAVRECQGRRERKKKRGKRERERG